MFENKVILVTGGTGSLGKVLTGRLLNAAYGKPKKIIIFSRDEAKQHFMRIEHLHKKYVTDEIIYDNFEQVLEFMIGDVRDYHSLCTALKGVDIVINAAALKQVPNAEYFPIEAVRTNILGAENIIRAISEHDLPVETVVGVSTDKACKPVNVMGMTKAIQERVFINGNISVPDTRFICVRYGNVLASRGSVIPLFHEQIRRGGPITITTPEMTRFILPLGKAVDTIYAAIKNAYPGETYIPKVPSAKMVDVATALIGKLDIKQVVSGIRPGEKIHEILVAQEEAWHTYDRGDFYAIQPMLPELAREFPNDQPIINEYSSKDDCLSLDEVSALLASHNLMFGQELHLEGELLR